MWQVSLSLKKRHTELNIEKCADAFGLYVREQRNDLLCVLIQDQARWEWYKMASSDPTLETQSHFWLKAAVTFTVHCHHHDNMLNNAGMF